MRIYTNLFCLIWLEWSRVWVGHIWPLPSFLRAPNIQTMFVNHEPSTTCRHEATQTFALVNSGRLASKHFQATRTDVIKFILNSTTLFLRNNAIAPSSPLMNTFFQSLFPCDLWPRKDFFPEAANCIVHSSHHRFGYREPTLSGTTEQPSGLTIPRSPI